MTGLDITEPAIDEIVAGKYRLTRMIGRGGMGSVWEGLHVTLDTRVAVKFIDSTYAESPEARQRFENEARAAARLNSKYAVQVYDHGVMPDGRPFIVMEFLVGEPLDARLDREGRIPQLETARIISQVSRALSRAHAAGIVHRDLKPENVFLVWDDEDQSNVAKVVDFGIAKFTDKQAGISSSTRTGSVLGTPYYMSPEQARGLRTVDFHTDLWSLGVIAYRCVVGRLPFEGESVGDLLVKICTAPLPIPSQVAPDCPREFDEWFARALQREPGDRFSSAQELAERLMIVCGLGAARPPFPSESLGSPGDVPGQGRLFASGNITPGAAGAAVAGVTAQPIAETRAAFAQTNSRTASTKRTLLWIAGGIGAFVVLVSVIVVAVFAGRSSVEASVQLDSGVASGVPQSAAASPPVQTPDPVPVGPSSGPDGASAPSVAVVPVPVEPKPKDVPPPPVSHVKPPTPSRPVSPSPRANPPVAPSRPTVSTRPIDLGY